MRKLKINTLSIALLAVAVLAGASLVYYFTTILPQRTSIEMKQKCLMIGKNAYDNDLKRFGDSLRTDEFLFDPEYAYNKTLNTCLYSSGIKKEDYWERWVIDAYTNKKIIDLIHSNDVIKDPEAWQKRSDLFWKEHDALMNDQGIISSQSK